MQRTVEETTFAQAVAERKGKRRRKVLKVLSRSTLEELSETVSPWLLSRDELELRIVARWDDEIRNDVLDQIRALLE